MRQLFLATMISGWMMGCGSSVDSSSSLQSGYPDTYPLSTQCWGASLMAPGSVAPVDYDRPSDVRLCAMKQKDGHIGLNVRYRKSPSASQNVYAVLHLRDRLGAIRSGVFTMRSLTAYEELYVSDGCVQGSFGGCAKKGDAEMQDLMADLLLVENGKAQTFHVDLRFLTLTPEDFEAGAYDSSGVPAFRFFVSGL